jgi:hypothetical protein
MTAHASIRKIGRSFVAGVAFTLLTGASIAPQAAFAIDIPTDCLADSDGANDQTAKTDLTKFCANLGDATPYELNTIINFDESTTMNDSDACIFFDTDGDAFINIAVCATIDGNSPGNIPFLDELRLFECNDTKADRCAGDELIAGPYSTTCEVSQQDTDPFPGPAPGPGADYPTDTQVLCGIDLDDFPNGGSSAVLQDACSFSSNNPNSAPSDCIAFQLCSVDADCNDNNPCTVDTCDTSDITDVCNFTPTPGEPCTDEQFCNGEEACTDQGLCGEGPGGPVDCDDEVSCTIDVCDELGDVCQNEPMNSICNDLAYCNGLETCDAILDCQDGTAPDCADTTDCTTDSCDEATDSCLHAPNHAFCDDGAFCDGSEVCDADTGCEEGTAPDCDDEIACTIDGCDEGADACTHTADDAVCDDDFYCTGEETCVVGLGCAVGPAPECDDSVECTTDACNEASDSCTFTPDDGACDNGEFCDGEETCNPSTGCEDGLEVSCGDGVDCTIDSCDEAEDECVHAPDHVSCSDGAYCDGDEVCDAVLDCQEGTAPDCDDEVGCTIDGCDETADACTNTPNDASCGDGLACNGIETCDVEEDCQDGTPIDCDDGVACTVDSCDEEFDNCDNVPDNAPCSDGFHCNGVELCGSTGCEAGEPVNCSDGVECTTDVCNEDEDDCDHTADDSVCDDGVFCDGEESCDLVNDCEEGTPPSCDDSVGCTIDSCDITADECLNTTNDASCSDGLHCNGQETCDAEEDCQDGTPPDCDDSVGCTDDSCDEDLDDCVNDPDDDSCSDGDFCTGDEVCNPTTGCGAGPDPCPDLQCDEDDDLCFGCLTNADCQNGSFCDGAETCLDGFCSDGPDPECDDGIACTVDGCDDIAGECEFEPSDALCDDGAYCNGEETCGSAGCEDGTDVVCDDSVACTDDSCNETTDSCDFAPDHAFCGDGAFCDGEEVCHPVNNCIEGTAPDCDDEVPCTQDGCDEDIDSCFNNVDHSFCDDDVFCDGEEVCDPETDCEEGTPPSCDDLVSCTEDSCDTGTDECVNTPSNAACDDDLHCNGIETCDAQNDCQPGTAPDCADAIPCTDDECNETTDMCDHTANDSLCEDGVFCNGTSVCDVQAGACTQPADVDCDDSVSCTQDSCNETTNQCDNVPDDDPCGDDVFCNGEEVCDPMAGCTDGDDPACDDGFECTMDSCSEEGEECINTPSNALCDDALYCNGDEVCTEGIGCQAGTNVDCGDAFACTVDSCNEGTDSCSNVPTNSLCSDGLFCNGNETCNVNVEGGCQPGNAPNCSDPFNCTDDSCDEATDSCLHDETTCVCGDLELYGTEVCDPPVMAGTFEDCNDTIDNDGDGRIDCRDQDCAPAAREPVCDEACTMDQVCARFIRDPARVHFSREGGPDEFYIHGRIPMSGEKLRSLVHALTFQLSNAYEPIYRVSLEPGDMRGGSAGRRFRFTDRDAKILGHLSSRNGLERAWVRTRRFGGERFLVFTIRAYGDFSRAKHRLMTTELSVGPERGYLTMEWKATPKGWVLHQKNFDDSIATLTPGTETSDAAE